MVLVLHTILFVHVEEKLRGLITPLKQANYLYNKLEIALEIHTFVTIPFNQ